MDNKNLIMGSVAIIVVVLVALLLFFPKDKENENKADLDNVKAYIHHEKTEEEKGYYSECSLSTEDKITVRNEFNNIMALTTDNMVGDKKINGDYKVIIDDKYIAFDKDHDNTVYISESNSLYTYESNIYDTVIKNCGSVNS